MIVPNVSLKCKTFLSIDKIVSLCIYVFKIYFLPFTNRKYDSDFISNTRNYVCTRQFEMVKETIYPMSCCICVLFAYLRCLLMT